jgi:hypothetical protein
MRFVLQRSGRLEFGRAKMGELTVSLRVVDGCVAIELSEGLSAIGYQLSARSVEDLLRMVGCVVSVRLHTRV